MPAWTIQITNLSQKLDLNNEITAIVKIYADAEIKQTISVKAIPSLVQPRAVALATAFISELTAQQAIPLNTPISVPT